MVDCHGERHKIIESLVSGGTESGEERVKKNQAEWLIMIE